MEMGVTCERPAGVRAEAADSKQPTKVGGVQRGWIRWVRRDEKRSETNTGLNAKDSRVALKGEFSAFLEPSGIAFLCGKAVEQKLQGCAITGVARDHSLERLKCRFCLRARRQRQAVRGHGLHENAKARSARNKGWRFVAGRLVNELADFPRQVLVQIKLAGNLLRPGVQHTAFRQQSRETTAQVA